MHKDPLVIIDAAHNPHGMSALTKSINSEFDFEHVIAVVALFADKDAEGILNELSTMADSIVVTQNDSPRALSADKLAKIAAKFFEDKPIDVITELPKAIEFAIQKATLSNQLNEGVTAIVVTGSVFTAGRARTLLKAKGEKK